jgi:hypothetical protein
MESILQRYLEMIDRATNGNSVPSAILKHGKRYEPPAVPRPKGIKKGKAHRCYETSYYLCVNKGFRYVEGYATVHNIPMEHAWVLDKHGNVIETTWETPGEEYYGIEIDIQTIHKIYLETKFHGVLTMASKTFRSKFIGGTK